MKKSIIIFSFLAAVCHVSGQQHETGDQAGDTATINILLAQSKKILGTDPDSGILVAKKAFELAQKAGFIQGQALAVKNIGIGYYTQGKYVEALEQWEQSLALFTEIRDTAGISNILNNISAIYYDRGEHDKALTYSLRALELAEKSGDKMRILSSLNNIGGIYFRKPSTYDKALTYLLRALTFSEELGDAESSVVIAENIGEVYFEKKDYNNAMLYYNKAIGMAGETLPASFALNGIGKILLLQKNHEEALKYHQQALTTAEKATSQLNIIESLRYIAKVYHEQGESSAALVYYKRALIIAEELRLFPNLKDLYADMSSLFASKGDYLNAYKYQQLYTSAKDSIYSTESDKKLATLQFEYDLNKKQGEINLLTKDNALRDARLKRQNLLKKVLFTGLGIGILFIVVLVRNIRQKQSAKKKIEHAYDKLKAAQQQLIHSEKMASLGELTAGIAHEIQNPLNFVNNFSEVSTELLDDMNTELEKGNTGDVKQIAGDLKQNLEKINFHGKRAGDIVKSMLQHSRSSSGAKELTDINALADEYLRLAYHGLRAKDKSFIATIVTDFDRTVGQISLVRQDIGRAILNLITNAFYAVSEKMKQQKDGYEPTVTVGTRKMNGKVLVSIKDNGNGIPAKLLDKIFQPFFTTKPTGQGTGLGLSLSYDIVKAHGGELRVETKEGEGTVFTIHLNV